MCDAGVMGRIAGKLGRRGVLGALAAAAALPVATAQAQPARGLRVVEMTHVLHRDVPTFGGTPASEVERILTFARDGDNVNRVQHTEHVGTHFDLPAHVSADGAAAEAVPASALVAPLVVLDVRAQAAVDPDDQVTPQDVAAPERAHGAIAAGACVAVNSGWAAHVATPRFRNPEADNVMRFPGVRPDVATLLLARDVVGVAVDTLSLDHGSSTDFAFHLAWLGAGRWGIECVAGLDEMPATGGMVFAGVPRIAGGTGGPGRVIGLA
jgi:kynurenine formamidase